MNTMNETIFTLNEGAEYIELYKLLKVTSMCGTGGEAKMCIAYGEAKVNGEVTTVKRLKIRPDMKVEFNGQTLGVQFYEDKEG